MVKHGKHEPTQPPEQVGSLKASMERALTDVAARERVSVRLRISGGLPAQAYRYHVDVSGGGGVSIELEDTPAGRRRKADDVRLPDEDVRELLETVRDSGVLDVPQVAPRFLPDTVVGRLQIGDGEVSQVIYFAADEAQAETQDQPSPPPLRPVLDWLYRLGGRVLELPSVKP